MAATNACWGGGIDPKHKPKRPEQGSLCEYGYITNPNKALLIDIPQVYHTFASSTSGRLCSLVVELSMERCCGGGVFFKLGTGLRDLDKRQ